MERGRGLPGHVPSSLQGWHETNNHSQQHLQAILKSPIKLICLSLDCRGKPEPPKGRERETLIRPGIEPKTFLLWGMLQCYKEQLIIPPSSDFELVIAGVLLHRSVICYANSTVFAVLNWYWQNHYDGRSSDAVPASLILFSVGFKMSSSVCREWDFKLEIVFLVDHYRANKSACVMEQFHSNIL